MDASSGPSGSTDPLPSAEELVAAARYGIPDLPGGYVPRPRLTKVLESAGDRPLLLVSAPAGTGKTCLVAEWVRSPGHTDDTGWVTFEDGDGVLWEFVLGCLRRKGFEVPAMSADSASLLGRARLLALAAALTDRGTTFTLVIDGYEMLSLDVARELDYLLMHSLGHLRLVLITRADPILPLYRYRLADRVREVRLADLAFADDEAAELLGATGVTIGGAAVRDVNERVRGWVAGLRFAAQAMLRGGSAETSAGAVAAQGGDISEYLIGEVLDAQTPQVREFLLNTSVTDVLSPGLAVALAGPTAASTLSTLEKLNAFVEPVAGQPGCFRYYPFFRDLLRARLAYESPHRAVELHRRAARWFTGQGLPEVALGHLAATGAWDEVAAQLVATLTVGRLLLEGPEGPLARVVRPMPSHLADPAACVVRAALALVGDDTTACAEELRRARAAAPQQDTARAHDSLVLCLAVVSAARASRVDEVRTAAALVAEAERAVASHAEHSETGTHTWMTALVQLSGGITDLRRGDLPHARASLTSAAGGHEAGTCPSFRATCLGYVAVIDALEGYLARAGQTAGESVALAEKVGIALARRSPAAEVAMACISLEQYDLQAVRRHVAAAAAARTLTGDPLLLGLTEGVIAGMERAAGRLQTALSRLAAASTRAESTDPWLADHLRLEAARVSVASGRAEVALRMLEAVGGRDEPMVAAVAAAAYAEQGRPADVEGCLALARSGEAPLQARVMGLLVEVVQESRRKSPARARVMLDQSLRLAAPEGLRRPFHESGPAVQRLLAEDPRVLRENRWLTHADALAVRSARRSGHPEGAQRDAAEVVEQLTVKELEVLRHLEELLTTEEIAERMFVSVNTVKTHVRSILRKLGVNRRNAAVRRARELGMLHD